MDDKHLNGVKNVNYHQKNDRVGPVGDLFFASAPDDGDGDNLDGDIPPNRNGK